MATLADYVRIDLINSLGVFPLTSVRVSEAVNQGVSWSASLADWTVLNPRDIPEDMEFCIRIKTKVDEYLSPPVVVEAPSCTTSVSGRPGSISGYDKSTYLLSKNDLTLDTFLNSTSTTILNRCVQTETGVRIYGLEDFPVEDDDVKNSKIFDVINRYIAYTAQCWIIERDGSVRIVPVTYAGPVNEELRYTSITDTINQGNRVDSLKIEKTSRISTTDEVCFPFDSPGFKTVQLPAPLIRATPIDRSNFGYCYMVTTFNGSLQGPVTGIFNFETGTIVLPGSQDIVLPTTHASLVVRRNVNDPDGTEPLDARICFNGKPVIPPDPNNPQTIPLSPAFRRIIGVGAEVVTFDPRGNRLVQYGTRPAREIWTDTAFPNADFVQAHALGYLRERNKDYHPQTATGPLKLSAALLQSFTSPGHPVATITSFEHNISVSGNSATTQINGHVPYPTITPSIDFW